MPVLLPPSPGFQVVLVSPQIPPKAGNVARTCAVTGSRLHLVGPLGFSLESKELKRAGLDYWEDLEAESYADWPDFEARALRGQSAGLHLFTARAGRSLFEARVRRCGLRRDRIPGSMSLLSEPGDLARTPLAALLLAALNERASGVLAVEHPRGTSRLYFRTGMPVGAQTFMGFRPLGQHLLQRGLIDMAALDESLARMARTHRPQGRILVELGAIDEPTLELALAEQQAGYVTLIAGLDAGAYRFDAAARVPEWTRAVRISPLMVIVDALEQPQAGQLAGAALAQAGAAIALTPVYRQVADKFGWSRAEDALVRRLETPARPEGVLGGADGVPPERARAMLAALLLLGLAEASTAPTGATPEVPVGLAAELDAVGATPPPGEVAAPAGADAGPARGAGPPGRGSDPDESRRRRQRLLARAIQNMGIAALGPPERAAAPAAAHAAAADRTAPTQADLALRRALEKAYPAAHDPDLFVRLGVAHDATGDAVKQAYLGLARQFHPDRFLKPALADLTPKVKELFAALNEAYGVLCDAQKRGEYGAGGGARQAPGGAPGNDPAAAAHFDFQKGEACVHTRDFPRARAFFESAIRGNPARGEYKAALAATFLADPRGKDADRARRLLQEAMKDPGCDRALALAAAMARADRDEAAAEQLYRAALRANPGNAEAAREVRAADERRKRKGEERALSKK